MNSDTPETDQQAREGAYFKPGDYNSTEGKQLVHIDFARKLERERNELKRKIATDFMAGVVIELEAERDAQIKETDQLKKVCELFRKTLNGFTDADLFDDQREALEAYNQLPHVKASK